MNPREQTGIESFLDELDSVILPLQEESEDPLAQEKKELNEYLVQKIAWFLDTPSIRERLSNAILYVFPTRSQNRPGGINYDSFRYDFAPSKEAFERERLPQLRAFTAPGTPIHLLTIDLHKAQDGIAQLLEGFGAKTFGDIAKQYGGMPQTFYDCGVAMIVEPAVSMTTYRIDDHEHKTA